MRFILLCGLVIMLAGCAACRLVSGGPVKVGPPIPLEIPLPLQGISPIAPTAPDASKEELQRAIQRRNQEITLLNGALGSLKAANELDRKTLREAEEARIREILYWVCGICLLVACLTGVAGFIPALTVFRPTLWGTAAGSLVVGCLAYALAPALLYIRYLVWGGIALAAVAGLLLLIHLYRTTVAAKLAAGLADRLKGIHPDDTEAIEAAQKEFGDLQAKFRVSNLTKRLRDNVVKQIPDKALRKAQEKAKALIGKI